MFKKKLYFKEKLDKQKQIHKLIIIKYLNFVKISSFLDYLLVTVISFTRNPIEFIFSKTV